MTLMRTRALPSQLPVGLRRMTWAPRCLVISAASTYEDYDFNQVNKFLWYLWMFFDYQFDCAQRHTNHGIADVGTKVFRTASPGSPHCYYYCFIQVISVISDWANPY